MTNLTDMTGQKIGRLTVLSRAGTNGGNATWNCKCDCGKSTIAVGNNMRRGVTRSCGCTNKRPYGEAAFHKIWNGYKTGAKKRGYIFELTREQFKELAASSCYYCDKLPAQGVQRSYHKFNGDFIYNGIDRLDNDEGYTLGNCVSCCSVCNMLKGKLHHDEFLEIVEGIYSHSVMDK